MNKIEEEKKLMKLSLEFLIVALLFIIALSSDKLPRFSSIFTNSNTEIHASSSSSKYCIATTKKGKPCKNKAKKGSVYCWKHS